MMSKILSRSIRWFISLLLVPLFLFFNAKSSTMDLWNQAEAPKELTETSSAAPLSISPILSWSKDVNAVMYEIEFFDHDPGHISRDMACDDAIYRSRKIYQNHYNPPLAEFAGDCLGRKPLYWRVRSLGFDGQPATPFSGTAALYTSRNVLPMNAPQPIMPPEGAVPLLYPVYNWVPQHDASSFIVQLFHEDPSQNAAAPLIDTMISKTAELYDQKPRYSNEDFFWRVHAVDKDGRMLGEWSKPVRFRTAPADHWEVAVFGDSISHGGGHFSFSPADREFSWLTYLEFPAINLSFSGDTVETMLDRFDADVLPFQPKYLLIFDGTNSLRSGVPAEDVIDSFEELKSRCLDAGIKPIFLTLPPINPANIRGTFGEPTAEDWQEQFRITNRYLRSQVHIDTADAFDEGDLPTKYALDGLHEDVLGKKRIAEAVNDAWAVARENADEK